MKQVLGVLGALLLAFIVGLAAYNCGSNPRNHNKDMRNDSILVTKVGNPTFYSVNEVISYQEEQLNKEMYDAEFLGIEQQTLETIAYTLIKRFGNVTKRQIVDEYRANSDIFDNLPTTDQTTTSKDSSSGMEDQGVTGVNKEPDSVSFQEKDTTINGTKAKILIRKELIYGKD